jgi:hypothetical protein
VRLGGRGWRPGARVRVCHGSARVGLSAFSYRPSAGLAEVIVRRRWKPLAITRRKPNGMQARHCRRS